MNVPAPSQTNATLTPCVQTPKDPIYVAVWKDLVAMEQSAKVTNSCQSLVVFNQTAVKHKNTFILVFGRIYILSDKSK